MPGQRTANLVATVFRQQRFRLARPPRYRARLARDRARYKSQRGLDGPGKDPAGSGGREHREKCSPRHDAALYRSAARLETDVSRIDGKGTPQSAAMAAPS